MKNYRVKSYGESYFIVQKRYWIFFWYTYSERLGMVHHDKKFNTKEDALSYAKEKKDADRRVKTEKFIKYV